MSELWNEADVLVDGTKQDIDRKSVKPKLGKYKREAKGAEGHFTTESIPGELTFKLAVVEGVDLAAVGDWVGKAIQVQGDNGLTYQSSSMFTTELGEPDAGYVEVKMAGKPFDKL